jgi:hypothetical protein
MANALAEIELLRGEYIARCVRPGCRHYPATTIVRYLNG